MSAVHFVATGAGVPFVYYVGKAIQNEGIDIPGRITAIDAGPGFEYPEWTNEFKDLANFTEAIHTSISYSGDNRQGRYVSYLFVLKSLLYVFTLSCTMVYLFYIMIICF